MANSDPSHRGAFLALRFLFRMPPSIGLVPYGDAHTGADWKTRVPRPENCAGYEVFGESDGGELAGLHQTVGDRTRRATALRRKVQVILPPKGNPSEEPFDAVMPPPGLCR